MQKHTVRDQMGRLISINKSPERIISLVPSQTELLFDLGLENEVVGITKFCIHPREMFLSKNKVGGTKKLNLQAIRDLHPDLIIGNKEENDQNQIEQLMDEFPVWMSDIYDLKDALEMIRTIGLLCKKEESAKKIAQDIQTGFDRLKGVVEGRRVAYFIWKDPWMLAGKTTFISNILEHLGMLNATGLERYPALSQEQIADLNPDWIFLSSEPYPFKDQHINELKAICPGAEIRLVDGEMFSWYGSRLLHLPGYLSSELSLF